MRRKKKGKKEREGNDTHNGDDENDFIQRYSKHKYKHKQEYECENNKIMWFDDTETHEEATTYVLSNDCVIRK